jgi:oligosaccharyltransferase complex subunit alpha (ribophorin I)
MPSRISLNASSNYHLVDVTLPKPLAFNGTLNIVLETVQTHATTPWPETAAQKEDQALKFKADLFVLSPYHTAVQRTKLKCVDPSLVYNQHILTYSPRALAPRVISFTTPKDVQEFTLDTPASQSGATVTYGPYNNIPPSANEDFIEKHQQPVVVHYFHEQPVLEVLKLTRSAEISHWGANLNIQDNVHLHNAGPA